MTFTEKTAIAAVIGGTADPDSYRDGGGKFANGAVTGAFVMAFNHLMHDYLDDNPPLFTPNGDPWQKVRLQSEYFEIDLKRMEKNLVDNLDDLSYEFNQAASKSLEAIKIGVQFVIETYLLYNFSSPPLPVFPVFFINPTNENIIPIDKQMVELNEHRIQNYRKLTGNEP